MGTVADCWVKAVSPFSWVCLDSRLPCGQGVLLSKLLAFPPRARHQGQPHPRCHPSHLRGRPGGFGAAPRAREAVAEGAGRAGGHPALPRPLSSDSRVSLRSPSAPPSTLRCLLSSESFPAPSATSLEPPHRRAHGRPSASDAGVRAPAPPSSSPPPGWDLGLEVGSNSLSATPTAPPPAPGQARRQALGRARAAGAREPPGVREAGAGPAASPEGRRGLSFPRGRRSGVTLGEKHRGARPRAFGPAWARTCPAPPKGLAIRPTSFPGLLATLETEGTATETSKPWGPEEERFVGLDDKRETNVL